MKSIKFIIHKLSYVLIFLTLLSVIVFYMTSINKDTKIQEKIAAQGPEDTVDFDLSETIAKFNAVSEGEQDNHPCRISILDVGQASCTVVESNGEVLVFDGGDRET